MTIYIVCALFVLIFAVYMRVRRLHVVLSVEPSLCLTKPHEVHELLSPSYALPFQLRSRALPNARLIRAFAITNTFVSDDMDLHSAFTRKAVALIRSAASTPADWVSFAEQAKDAADRYVSYASPPFEYEPFIQYITFSIILSTLFHVETHPNPDDILAVTRGINELWGLSKTSKDLPPHVLESLNGHLHSWITDYPNPLNFILPTFETMWRVVAVAVARSYKDIDALNTFEGFLTRPTASQFTHFEMGAPSVEAVIAETMRLHPPTRRIHRAEVAPQSSIPFLPNALTSFMQGKPRIHIADIGAVHRDADIWGGDADVFKPLRHHPGSLTAEQRESFMPFGYGKLKCVASSWAPHAAGLIAAAVLSTVSEGMQISEGCGIGGREGWEGWAIEMAPAADEESERC